MGESAELERRAEAGEAAAQYTIAYRLLSARELTEQNRVRGINYLERAAAQDHLPALLELAERLAKGRDLKTDDARSVVLLTKAVELGSPRGAALLGSRYFDGAGVEKDEKKAFALYQKSADGGYAWGRTMVAWSLEFGRGVEKDLPAAVEHYRRAAEGKDQWAKERLARLLSDRKQPFYNEEEARKWAFAGARQGSEELRGLVLESLLAGAPASAAEEREVLAWLREDVAKDKAFALFYSAHAAWQGWHTPRDWSEAAKLYGRAAEKNHVPALHLYARCLAAGVGVPQDLAKAREWRAKAADSRTPAPLLKTLDGLIAAMAWPLPEPPAGVEFRPQAILQDGPSYPWRMAQAKISGEVVVEFVIGQDGRTKELRVVRSSHLEFEVPALTAVAFWRFEPGVRASRHVDTLVSQLIEFNLEDEKARHGVTAPPLPLNVKK
jgi:TonB family protein